METTIRSNTFTNNTNSAKLQQSFWAQAEYNRFGIIPILLLIIGCAGGIAAAFGAQADILKLGLIAFPTIIALAMVLAVAPMRVIGYVSLVALLADLSIFIF
jgi:hypothetical protein